MKNLKVLFSLVLTLTVTSLFTLHVYAADDSKQSMAQALSSDSFSVEDFTGTLTIKSGKVLINGNEVQTGATVTSGDIVTTNDQGRVIIDLGTHGRLELGHHTSATIDCTLGVIHGHTICGDKVHIEAHLGHIDVTEPKVETILAGKAQTYDNAIDFTAPFGSSIEIECGHRVGGLWIWSGWLGVLTLIGVAVTVDHGGDKPTVPRPPVSGA